MYRRKDNQQDIKAEDFMLEFPVGFFWGAATAAYQVEGDNINTDWWEWEKRVGLKETSGKAARHYQFYRDDFRLAKSLNHNAHRLSVEWSRIEPQEGRFSPAEIAHYKDVVSALKEYNLEPIVTLHHFTNPLWFVKLGGWQNKESAVYFSRFVAKIVEALCGDVRYWITINEPLVYVYHSYILGNWPPQEKSFFKANVIKNNLIIAHIKAYGTIHDIYKKKGKPPAYVSIAKNLQIFTPLEKALPCSSRRFTASMAAFRNKLSAGLRDWLYNLSFIETLAHSKTLDFIGVNYYTRTLVEVKKCTPRDFLLGASMEGAGTLEKNYLGWDIYPEGIYQVLMKLKKYNLPVFITENGICTEDDLQRWDFILQHLKNVHRAIKEGINVIGYLYWSLIDNFEWDKGFGPRFGLCETDYLTYKRTVRKSAQSFSLVCKTGRLE